MAKSKEKKLTPAEKQRLYRQRRDADSARRQVALMKARDKWHNDVKTGKVKLINNVLDTEKRRRRQKWKAQQKEHRLKKNNVLTPSATPPVTPSCSVEHLQLPNTSRQKIQGRKRIRRDRAKCYHRLAKLEQELTSKNRIINKYKKKLERVRKRIEVICDSPAQKQGNCYEILVVQYLKMMW